MQHTPQPDEPDFTEPVKSNKARVSAAITCLEQVWCGLRDIDQRIPPVVLSVLSAADRKRLLGYFAKHRWVDEADGAHEVSIHPGLFKMTAELLGTLVHEAAHAILVDRRGGVSDDGYYHRSLYRNTARELGLECTFRDTRHGFANTTWPNGVVDVRYAGILRLLENMPNGTKPVPPRALALTRPLPPRGLLALECACTPPNRVYAPKSVRLAGVIRCDVCNQLLVPGN